MTISNKLLQGDPATQGAQILGELHANKLKFYRTREQEAIMGPILAEKARQDLVEIIDNSERALTGNLFGLEKNSHSDLGSRTQAVVRLLTGIDDPNIRMFCIGHLVRATNVDELMKQNVSIADQLGQIPDQSDRAKALCAMVTLTKERPAIGSGHHTGKAGDNGQRESSVVSVT